MSAPDDPTQATRARVRALLGRGDESAVAGLFAEARRATDRGDHPVALRVLKARETLMTDLAIGQQDSRWGHGWVHAADSLRFLGRLEPARRLGERAVHAAQQHEWSGVLRTGVLVLARVALEGDDLPRAAALATRAVSLARQHGHDIDEARAIRLQGSLAERRGSWVEAVALHRDAIERLGRAEAPLHLASALQSLAGVLLRRGSLDEAEGLVTQALAIFEHEERPTGSAGCRWVRGSILLARGQVAEAEAILQDALQRYRDIGFLDGIARARVSLGEAARVRGDLDHAEACYHEAIAAMRHAGSDQIAIGRFNLGLVALERGDWRGARATLESVQRELEASGRLGLAGAARIACLPSMAATGDWIAWDEAYLRGVEATRGNGLVDPDIARAARKAGSLARQVAATTRGDAAEPILARATRGHELAVEQWRALGRHDEASRDEESLRRLSTMGAATPLGPFDLAEPIGQGAMGQVWRARHRASGTEVAIKVISHEAARSARAHDAFRDEVRAMARLDHPHIAMVLDHGEVGSAAEVMTGGRILAGSPYLAMELAGGGALESACGTLPWQECRQILIDLLDALAHAHARGVVHRDLKPANVLLFDVGAGHPLAAVAGLQADRRVARLTDFGLAHALFEGRGGLSGGTPQYMAPEQFRGAWRDFGPWTDLYALGCLAWDLVTGQPPFAHHSAVSATRNAQLSEDLPDLRPRIAVPAGLEAWLRRLTHKHPGDRYQRAADAADALRRLGRADVEPLDGAPVGSRPTSIETVRATWLAEARDSLPPTVELPPPPEPDGSERARVPAEWREDGSGRRSTALLGAGLALFGLRQLPLVDRDRERELLWTALRGVAADDRPRAIVVRGATGCGKSHLVRWFTERAHEVGAATVLHATHGPAAGPLDGLGQLVVRALRIAEPGSEVEALARARLRELGGVDEADAAPLAELAVPGSTDVRFAAPTERYGPLLRLLRRLGQARAVVLWLDDAQWGADALAFALHVLEQGVGPILIAIGVRDEDLAARPLESDRLDAICDVARTGILTLGPLSDRDHAILVRRHLRLEGALADTVESRTGGNPLFAVQLVGDWVARDLLRVGRAGFVLREGAEAALPDGIHDVWRARLDTLFQGLPRSSRQAVELAAVLGANVAQEEWVQAGTQLGIGIDERVLERLLQTQLARRIDGGWCFSHGAMRESLLRTSREARRDAELHAAVAAMLTDRGEVRSGAELARRGRHLRAAGHLEAALEPLVEAARAFVRTGDHAEARACLELHADTLAGLAVPAHDPRHASRELERARLGLEAGDLDDVEELAETIVLDGRRHGWRHAVAEGHRIAAEVAYRRGTRAEAEKGYRTARSQFEALGDKAGEGRALYGMALVARATGDLHEARRRMARARTRLQDAGDPEWAARATFGLGGLASQAGDTDEAARHYRDAQTRYEAIGARGGIATCLNGLGDLARRTHDLDGAEDVLHRALAMFRSMGSGQEVYPLLNLGLVHLDRGALTAARAALLAAQRMLEQQGRIGLLGTVHALLLAPEAAEPDPAAWERHLRLGRTLLAQTGVAEPDTAQTLEQAAARAQAAGYPHRGRDALRLARELWQRLGRVDRVERIDAALVESSRPR